MEGKNGLGGRYFLPSAGKRTPNKGKRKDAARELTSGNHPPCFSGRDLNASRRKGKKLLTARASPPHKQTWKNEESQGCPNWGHGKKGRGEKYQRAGRN